MKRILRFAICAALCLALLLADLCVIPAAESFYPSADLLLIKNHIENEIKQPREIPEITWKG